MERRAYPKDQKQAGFKYHNVMINHLAVTMHDVGFEKGKMLCDTEYVAQQSFRILWREAVVRGVRPVTNRELVYGKMFPESENGLSLPKMNSIA